MAIDPDFRLRCSETEDEVGCAVRPNPVRQLLGEIGIMLEAERGYLESDLRPAEAS
jgi:hypothetical protein